MRIFSWQEHQVVDRTYYMTRQKTQGAYQYLTHTHHGQFEIILVLKGILEHHINGQVHHLRPGWMQLVREQDTHGLRGTNIDFYNLSITTGFLAGLETYLCAWNSDRWSWFQSQAVHPPFRSGSLKLGDVESLFQTLMEKHDVWKFLPILAQILEKVTLPAQERLGETMVPGGMNFEEEPNAIIGARTLQELPRWLSELIAKLTVSKDIPSVSDLPTWLGLSPAHISRSFRRYFGISPSTYLTRMRLDRAAQILRHGQLTIGETAQKVGFSSSNYFYKEFRARFGKSPGEFKRGLR